MKHRRNIVDRSLEDLRRMTNRSTSSASPHSTCSSRMARLPRSRSVLLALLLACFAMQARAQNPKPDWKTQVTDAMPLLGHRNWILVVDSAYPLENSRGIETIETNSDELTVLRSVLDSIHASRHVRPVITLDSELAFVPEDDAPGASAYRAQIGKILQGFDVQSQPHETILKAIDKEGRIFHILVLKTNMTIPYTSVFIRLDCKYWSADAEKRMRAKMNTENKVRLKQHSATK